MDRRGFMGLVYTSAALALEYQMLDYALPRMRMSYGLEALVDDLPVLEKIILREGEIYFSAPESEKTMTEPEEIASAAMAQSEIYPSVVRWTDDFLGINQETLPTLTSRTLNRAVILGYGASAALSFGSSFRAKREWMKLALRLLSVAGVVGILRDIFTAGTYNYDTHQIQLKLPESRLGTTLTLAHENAHAIFFNHLDKAFAEKQEKWIVEGVAGALAYLVLEKYDAIPDTQNAVREHSLQFLVSTYRLVCEKEELEQHLPKKYDQFDSSVIGIRNTDDYHLGYTFFRIRAEQRGNGIFSRILTEKSLAAVEPLPSEKFTDIWL